MTGTIFEVHVGLLVIDAAGLARAGATKDCPALPELPHGRAVYDNIDRAFTFYGWAVRRFHDQTVTLKACRHRRDGGHVVNDRELSHLEHEQKQAAAEEGERLKEIRQDGRRR